MPNEGLKTLELIKEVAVGAIEARGTCNFVLGKVTSTDPLAIQLENGFTIPEDNIVLTKNTCLWSVDMTVDHQTEDASGGSGDAEYAAHHHAYKGTKTYLVHNEMSVGDEVILGRAEGGQKYIALDRKYNPDRGCKD